MAGRHRPGLIGQLAQSRQGLIEEHLAGLPGSVFVRRYADWVEEVVRRLFNEAVIRHPRHASVCLMALGGFGRGELNLCSDVDLMFLHPSFEAAAVEDLAGQVLYPLWDLNLEVGHAARSLEDCLTLAAEDFQILVSMLTARRLTGAEKPAEELARGLARSLGSLKAKRAFLEKVRLADQERQARFGHTPYLLEPHLKEGEGGLRDIHAITWIGLGCLGCGRMTGLAGEGLLTDDEVAFVGEARDFLWRVRNHLHYLARGRDDRLTFERQEKVSAFFGLKDEGGLSGVEQFMRGYYSRAFGLRHIRDLFFERAQARFAPGRRGSQKAVEDHFVIRDNKLHLDDLNLIGGDKTIMMRLFAVSALSGVAVSHEARQQVRRRLALVDDEFRRDEKVAADFFSVLMPPQPQGEALFALHGSGLLMAYLPELAGVFQLPQHDAYHIYTVDVHQLWTVARLNQIRFGSKETDGAEMAQSLLAGIKDPRLLYLAALFHDVGKAHGQGHAERGAEMTAPALKRLGLGEEEAELVRFLVGRHLLLTITANRRDIHDEKLLFETARTVGDQERLNMLYLLTIADSQATGPKAWSSWQSSLIRELYFKTSSILSRSDIETVGSPEWLTGLRGRVKELLCHRVEPEEVERHLDNCSDQYLLFTATETIAEHIALQDRLTGRLLVFDVQEKRAEGYCQLTVVTKRRPGLFGRLAGVLTLNGLNILGGNVYTRRDKVLVTVYQVEFPPDPYTRPEKWAQVETDMERALSGRLALEVRLAQRLSQIRARPWSTPRRPTEVVVNNAVSDFHTVVEVTAHDRLGLLYDITRVFYDLDLEIHIAKISTKIDQVVDVFYVTNLESEKVEKRQQIEEMKAALTAILD